MKSHCFPGQRATLGISYAKICRYGSLLALSVGIEAVHHKDVPEMCVKSNMRFIILYSLFHSMVANVSVKTLVVCIIKLSNLQIT